MITQRKDRHVSVVVLVEGTRKHTRLLSAPIRTFPNTLVPTGNENAIHSGGS